MKTVYWFVCVMMTRVHQWCFVFEEMVDIDYEPWLGPNWRKELSEYNKKIPTIVTNHSSFLDIWFLSCSRWEPSYLAKVQMRKTIACR